MSRTQLHSLPNAEHVTAWSRLRLLSIEHSHVAVLPGWVDTAVTQGKLELFASGSALCERQEDYRRPYYTREDPYGAGVVPFDFVAP